MDYITERALKICELAGDEGELKNPGAINLYRIYAVLSFAKGIETTPVDVHDAWTAWQVDSFPGHRSAVPFDQLSPQVQSMDDIYVEAIHKAATE